MDNKNYEEIKANMQKYMANVDKEIEKTRLPNGRIPEEYIEIKANLRKLMADVDKKIEKTQLPNSHIQGFRATATKLLEQKKRFEKLKNKLEGREKNELRRK
jgi:hypothetical protein